MNVFMHARTHARPCALMHLCPYVRVYNAGRQAGTHTHPHVYMHVLMYASVMHVFTRFRICMYVRTSCAPAKTYQSPVRARAHSDKDLYCSQKLYGSFCDLSRVT